VPNDHKILVELKQCVRNCNGNQACVDACLVTFQQAGGTVTADSGSIVTAPDSSNGFVTKGGKVFGGKVF
jgi:hypothetical protein